MFEPIKNYETYGITKKGVIKDYRTGKLINCSLNKSGYKKLQLVNPEGKKGFLVHRLVALQFIKQIEGKNEVDHIDRNRINNNIENLRWVNDIEQVENRGNFKNNKLNEKYICFETDGQTTRYRLQITKNYTKILSKSFNTKKYTLNDVILYRDDFLKTL